MLLCNLIQKLWLNLNFVNFCSCRQYRWILFSSFHWLIQNIHPSSFFAESKMAQIKLITSPRQYAALNDSTHTYSKCSYTFVVFEMRWHAISHLILTGSVSCDMLVSATFILTTVLDRLPAGICLSSVCGLNTAVSKQSVSSSLLTATSTRWCNP